MIVACPEHKGHAHQAIAEGDPPPPPGGGSEAKKVRVPDIGLKFPASEIEFIFARGKGF